MNWRAPEVLTWLPLIVIGAAILFAFGEWQRRQRLKRSGFGIQNGKGAEAPGTSSLSKKQGFTEGLLRPGITLIKALLLIVAIIALGLGWAGPRFDFKEMEVATDGFDLMVAIDTSASMRAQDVRPDRLTWAKREVLGLLDDLEGDRLGLTVFAEGAYVQVPLTNDYSAIEIFLGAVSNLDRQNQGTDLGSAIEVALDGLTKGSGDSPDGKAILVVTDGEDWQGRGERAAAKALAAGVKVFTISIGTGDGAPIPLPDGGFKRDNSGKIVITKPDQRALQQVANAGGGRLVAGGPGEPGLSALYKNILPQSLGDAVQRQDKERIWEEEFAWPLTVAFLLLVIEGLLVDVPSRRTRSSQVRSSQVRSSQVRSSQVRSSQVRSSQVRSSLGKSSLGNHALVLLLAQFLTLVLYSFSDPLQAAPSDADPAKAYSEGRYEEASEGYLKSEIEDPNDFEAVYNRGVSLYRAGRYEEAASAFRRVAREGPDDLGLKGKFALGNTLVGQDKLEEALGIYNEILKTEPDHQQASENAAHVARLLEEQKNKPDQQQDQQQKNEQPEQKQNEQEQQQSQGQQDGEPQGGDSQAAEPRPGDPEENEPGEDEQQQGGSKESLDSQPQNGQSQKGQSQDGQPQEGQSQDRQPQPGETQREESRSGESQDQQRTADGDQNPEDESQVDQSQGDQSPDRQSAEASQSEESANPAGAEAEDTEAEGTEAAATQTGEQIETSADGSELQGRLSLSPAEARRLLRSLKEDDRREFYRPPAVRSAEPSSNPSPNPKDW